MRVLVTGGAGFIGSHIADALVARGEEAIVLDDFSRGSTDNVPDGADVVRCDVTDPAIVDVIAELRPTVVVHAAAQISVPNSMVDSAHDRAVNLLGTEHVLQGARQAGVRRIVFLSTGGGIYGETSEPATEASLPRPSSFYGVHKYAAERYVELSGLGYAIARLANVYGPRQRSGLEGGVIPTFADRLATGRPVTIHGDGAQCRDFVHVGDVVRAILQMIDADLDGIWNVGSGQETSVNGLLELMQEVFGPAAAVRHEPARAGDIRNSSMSIAKIDRDLGWRPATRLRSGIEALDAPW